MSDSAAWRAHARCSTADPDLFFPAPTASAAQVAEAKRFCASCPVKRACLEDAIRHNEREAICGGLTAQERDQMLRPGEPPVARRGRMSAREMAVKHGSYLLVCLVDWQMTVAEVAEQLGSTPSAVHRAYLMLVPARPGETRSKKPSVIEELVTTSKERLETLERIGRTHEEIGVILGTSQSMVSAALAVLRQREGALRRLSRSGGDPLQRIQDEEFRVRRESGFGLSVSDVVRLAGRDIERMRRCGVPLRQVAQELGLCRETVRLAYRGMTGTEERLTKTEMGAAA